MSRHAAKVVSGPREASGFPNRTDQTSPDNPLPASHSAEVMLGVPEEAKKAVMLPPVDGVRRFVSPIVGLVISRQIKKEKRVDGEVEVEAIHKKFQANQGLIEARDPGDIAFLEAYCKRKPAMLMDVDLIRASAERQADDNFIARAKADPRLRKRVVEEFGGDVFELGKNPAKDGPGRTGSPRA